MHKAMVIMVISEKIGFKPKDIKIIIMIKGSSY
jgi:hypothetical protein